MLILWKGGYINHSENCNCPVDEFKNQGYRCIACGSPTISPNSKAIKIDDEILCGFIKKLYAN